MSDILISGYYGFKNSGDDALLLSIIQQLKKQEPNIKINVLSKNPVETRKVYKVKSVKRDNIFAVISSVMATKMLILGGGTLIQDSTSTKSLLYYLFIICMALIFRKKVMLYANGIGPLKKTNRALTKMILNRVDMITLREKNSEDELKKLGINKPEIVLTADCAFCFDSKGNSDVWMYKKKMSLPENMRYFCVAVRDDEGLPADFCRYIADMCDYITKKYRCYAVFMPFQKTKDVEIANKIRGMMKSDSWIAETEYKVSVMLDFMAKSEMCIGMRLHSLIYSAIGAVPLIGLVYDQKVTGFMEYIGQKHCLDANTLKYDKLIKEVDYCFAHKDEIKKEISENLGRMRKLAQSNAVLAVKLLKE